MGLFDKIFQPKKAKESLKALKNANGYFETLTAYRPVFTSWCGEIYESELVRAAIDAIARHVSKLKVTFEGSANPKLQTKMKLAPNQWQTYSQMLYRAATIWAATGNCIITPVFDDNMVITGYIPVLPERCSVVEYKGEPWLRYEFARGKVGAVELRKCAILTRHQFKDDLFGTSNTALHDTMRLINIQRQAQEEAARNSSTYRFMAKLDNWSTAEDLANERKRFSETNLASDANGGGLLLFPNTYSSIQQLNQSAYKVDAEQMQLIQTNVSNYFGVNLKILQNSASADELDSFFNGCVEPWAIMFSEAMTMAIFSERERANGARLIANANRLQYMNTTQKVAMAKELGDRGAITIDEIRELFNYPPLPEGAGTMAPIRGEYYDATETGGADDAN